MPGGTFPLALAHLHKNKIVHRDLKLQNLLLVDVLVKIANSGLCKTLDPNKIGKTFNSQTEIGTHQYMAPELLNKTIEFPYTDFAHDIWAAGCILLIYYGKVDFLQLKNAARHFAEYKEFNALVNEKCIPKVVKSMISMCLVLDSKKRATAQQV